MRLRTTLVALALALLFVGSTGAGVLKAQATITTISNPTSAQIAEALDCPRLGWSWFYTRDHCTVWNNTDFSLDWVALDKVGSQESQLHTSVHGPGTLSFKWCADISDQTSTYSNFVLVFDGKVVATCSRPINPGPNFATATVDIPAGEHTLFWILTGTSKYDYNSAYLDDVHFTPQPVPNEPTKTSVLASLATLKNTVKSTTNSAFYPGTKIALIAVIDAATLQVKYGKYDNAAKTLQSTFVTRTDGCALRGTPDKTDLVRTCEAQAPKYAQAASLVQELQSLHAHTP